MIRVLICAETRLYRDGVAQFLIGRQEMQVVGSGRPTEAEADARASKPDVVLFDVSAPQSLSELRELTAAGLRAVAIAIPEREEQVVACAEAGVAGYVTVDESLEKLVATIESVARGETLCSPRLAATLLRRVAALADARGEPGPVRRLTIREHEIAQLLGDGLSNKEIASYLRIEVPTVKNHVHNILEKLGVHRRAEAAARLRETDLSGQRI